VERGQLAHHPADQVGQLVAGGDAVHERQVLVQHGLPVDAVHAGVVEVIALQAPGVHEDLAPVLAHVDGKAPSRQVDAGIREARDLLVPGIDDRERVSLPEEQLLAVPAELVTLDVLRDGDPFVLVAGERDGDERATAELSSGARLEEESRRVGAQVGVVAGRDGNLREAEPDALELDVDRGGCPLGLGSSVGGGWHRFVRSRR
jgi:hypothetical protein